MNLILKLLTCLGSWLIFASFSVTVNYEQGVGGEKPVTSTELFDRGFALVNEDVSKADSLITLAWRMAYSDHDAVGIANGYFYKGCIFDRRMMLDSAIQFLEKSLELYIHEDAWTNVPDAYGRIGLLKFKKNNIQEGLEYLIKGIQIAERRNNQESIVRLSIVLAMHHNDYTAHYQEAIGYLQKAEESATRLKDQSLLAHIYLQYSISYQQLNSLEKAESYSRKSIQSFGEINSSYNKMRALFTLGGVYSIARESEKLLSVLAEVQPMLLNNPDDLLQANYDKLYAEAVFIQGDFNEALRFAQHSALLLAKGGQTQGVHELNKLQYRIYYALGDIEKADSLYHRTSVGADSIFSARAYRIDSELRQKYNSEAKQHQIDLQTLQLQHGLNLRYGLLGLLVLLGALAISFYKSVAVKKRLIELNELLLNEVNHRVKNNLQLLSSILNIQNRKLETEEAKDLIKKCLTRMKTFTIIHDTLYKQNNMDSIDMGSFIAQLCDGNETANGEEVLVIIEANGVQLKVDFAMHIGLIINELVTNTYKYAFSERTINQLQYTYEDVIELEDSSSVNEIRILLEQTHPTLFEIRYQDSGPGISSDFDIKSQKSMGMKIIYGLVRQMQGSVRYDSELNQFLIQLKNKQA